MLTVEEYEAIRRKVRIEGRSQRAAARELGHSRRTVKKALEAGEPLGYRRRAAVSRPAIGPVQGIIDAWLEQDKKRERKQRHTSKRIWERLCEEYGFAGSVSAVRRYVKERRQHQGEVYFPLSFELGEEAQVDWGEVWVVLNQRPCKVLLFCMRLCYSAASFVRAYLTQDQTSLLDGHVRAFEYFGGVPRRLAYDNPKTIVTRVGLGRERTLTARFVALRSHYLFETRFCNVACGNEKGHVENLVKRAQRTYATPEPQASDLEGLNVHFALCCRKDLAGQASRRQETRGELLEQERALFLALPARPFDACVTHSTFASKESLVRVRGNDYSVPVCWAHHPVLVRLYVERVELWHGEERLAVHRRSFGSGEFILDPYHYIPLLERKPGGLLNGRPFKGEPWGEDFTRLRDELEYRYGTEGTRKFVRVLLLFAEFPQEAVKTAVAACVLRRAFSDEAVRVALTQSPRPASVELDLSRYPGLQVATSGTRPAVVYEALLAREVWP